MHVLCSFELFVLCARLVLLDANDGLDLLVSREKARISGAVREPDTGFVSGHSAWRIGHLTHKKDTATTRVISPVISMSLSKCERLGLMEGDRSVPLPRLQAAVVLDVKDTKT